MNHIASPDSADNTLAAIHASRNAVARLVRATRRAGHKVITRNACNTLCLSPSGAMGWSYLCSGYYVKRA